MSTIMDQKLCNQCGETWPLDQMIRGKRYAGGVRPWCRKCHAAYQLNYMNQNRERMRAKNNAWRKANPLPEEERRRRNFKRAGLMTPQEYDDMLMTQCGLCAACGQSEKQSPATKPDDPPRRLSIHHDHTTGLVVALLCGTCNVGLGMFKDNPDLLRCAADLHEEALAR